ncbi:hypothetical protein ACROYT_G027290 [Oculina patagonica]
MATAAPSKVFLSTHEKENFQRIARLLVCGGTSLLREIFDQHHPPDSLAIKLNNPIYKNKLKGARLTKPQWDCLYPTRGACGTSADFDISLLFRLLRTICNLTPPATGWDVLPQDTDHILSAELVRIKEYRNQLYHGYPGLELSDEEFRSLWKSVSTALEGVAGSMGSSARYEWKIAIDKLLTDPLTTPDADRNVKKLKEWFENDSGFTKAINQLEVSFQGGMESVQKQLKQTGESVQEQLKQTGESVQKQLEQTGKLQEQLKQAKESIVRQLQETIAKEISASSPLSPERQPNNLLGPGEQRVLGNSSAGTSGTYQSSQATVHALDTSTQIRESPSEATSTGTSAELRKSMQVNKIVDFQQLFEIISAVGMKTDGLKTMEEMKEKLRDYIEESSKRQQDAKTFHVISEAVKADEHKRRELCRLYDDTRDVLNQLDDDFMKTLGKRLGGDLGDFRTTLEENIKNLAPRDQYVVLVAGETSAGKSSVINLILGEEILPNAVLSTTSTIFELKYGEKPMIGLHFKDNDGSRDPMYYELTGSKETYEQQITNLAGQKKGRGKVSPYKKVELFWPHPLFQERVMIVDSPGVGENDDMNESVLDYLPNAFCFIYVINSTNAGGIQEDRLGVLLSGASRLKREAKMDLKLFASCALFVCNKWDEIKPSEVEEVKLEQIEKLTKRLDSFDPKSQIVYLSCKKAQKAQEYSVITGDFHDLINGISNLIVSSISSNLQIYTSWLDDLLSRASRQIRILLKSTSMSRLEKNRRMEELKKRMEELQSSHGQTLDKLSEYQSELIWEIMGKLAFHFKSQDTSKRFCEWSPDEVPAPGATWEETENEVLRCISERSQKFVQDWEDEEREFATARDKMIKTLCQNFGALLSKIKEKLNYQTKLQSYEKDPCAYMSNRCRESLKVISTQDHLLVFIQAQLEDSIHLLRQMREKIPKLIEGDQQLYHKLLEDTRSTTEIQNFYEPHKNTLESLKRDVTVYKVKEIRRSDFTAKELRWTENSKSIIGTGSFSIIYSGVLSRKGEREVKVALKVYKDRLTRENVWHFIDEEQALRQLRHPSLLRFYGTNLQKTPNGTKVVMVLELCKCSLKSQIMSHPEKAPARLPNEEVRRKVLHWAMQILDALRYVHGQGFVHQNLKLENVLLTQSDDAKLTGIGVGKFETEAERSPRYLAPEVLEGRIYDSQSEMYSFGLILWEMWYGVPVSSQSQHLDGLKKAVRPSHIEGTHCPWEIWQNVMESCWRSAPRERLTAKDSLEHLKKLHKEKVSTAGKERPTPTPKPFSRKKPRVAPKPFKKE